MAGKNHVQQQKKSLAKLYSPNIEMIQIKTLHLKIHV